MGIKTYNKKGVSPLIATVLLIAFAVALGAVVMNWGRTQFTEETPTTGPCSEIDFGIEILNDNPDICFTEDKLSVLVYNNGNRAIKDIKFTVFSINGDPHNAKAGVSLSPIETKRIQISLPSGFGNVQKVRLVPEILPNPEKPLSSEFCSNNLVEVIQPGFC